MPSLHVPPAAHEVSLVPGAGEEWGRDIEMPLNSLVPTRQERAVDRAKDKMKNYTCECCGGSFDSPRSEEETLQEMRENFGDIPEEHRARVCDDCYRKVLSTIKDFHQRD